jgi:hypothetical protein
MQADRLIRWQSIETTTTTTSRHLALRMHSWAWVCDDQAAPHYTHSRTRALLLWSAPRHTSQTRRLTPSLQCTVERDAAAIGVHFTITSHEDNLWTFER